MKRIFLILAVLLIALVNGYTQPVRKTLDALNSCISTFQFACIFDEAAIEMNKQWAPDYIKASESGRSFIIGDGNGGTVLILRCTKKSPPSTKIIWFSSTKQPIGKSGTVAELNNDLMAILRDINPKSLTYDMPKELLTLNLSATVLTIDAKGKTLEDVVGDILLDNEKYNFEYISIENVTFLRFGISPASIAYYPDNTSSTLRAWFRNADTYMLEENPLSERRRAPRFIFWFQAADREGRKLALDLTGKYYTSPKTVTLEGFYHRIRDGSLTYNPFIVSSFVIDGKEYKGKMPSVFD